MASAAIKEALKAAPEKTMKIKNLQNKVMDGSVTKAEFKAALIELNEMGRVTIDGKMATLEKKTKAMKRKSGGEGAPASKKKKVAKDGGEAEAEADAPPAAAAAAEEEEEEEEEKEAPSADKAASSGSSKHAFGNGCTRVFLGNLSFKIDEDSLKNAIPGVTHIKWITDKESGKFYGSAFVEMKTAEKARQALDMAGSKILGRELKANFAPAREGDIWPPVEGQGDYKKKELPGPTEKPFEGCNKLFLGNLAYDIEDEDIHNFFADCGTVVRIRYLTHQHNGDFKGIGYADFDSSEAADAAILLNGLELKGRRVRLDWDSRIG